MTIRRPLAFSRLLKLKASKRFKRGTRFMSQVGTISDLKSEIALLNSYSTDTIYRLRYDTMSYDYISTSVTRLLGYSPEEMKRVNIRKLILETRIITDGMRAVRSFAKLEDTRKRGEVQKWQADYLMRTKDGRQIWVSDVSHPWIDERGVIIGSIGSLRDITDRIQAEDKVKDELVKIANTDSLTGIANRRNFFTRLDEEIKRAKRTQAELAILLIDVDHFKKINDNHGHDAGDEILVGVTKIINSCLRETDLSARLGGEEFGCVLPDTPIEGAYWVAERIRASIAKQSFAVGVDKRLVGCTVSIGVGSTRMDSHMDSTRLYKLADTRLYIAKNTGRNQVSIDELVSMH